ncbi:MAG TPA: CRTAC1 family protein [Bryobacteraceae bacterium]|nr:CRTAC1 family protein [Bryobacteraceae bacterium]
MRWRCLVLLIAVTAVVLELRPAPAGEAIDPIRFEDIAERAGLRFAVRNSATGQNHQIETMIAGVAVFDYNNDGKPDIYFVNGARIPELTKTGPEFYNRLYRNNGDGTFTDVTAQAGVAGEGYGMGVAAGDFDNDGFVDLFLPGVNRNILYHNRGDGTFEDVTKAAGLEGIDPKRGKMWSIAAGWFDYDNDGRLDLFVVNYCAWKPQTEPFCGDLKAGYRTYCHPEFYDGLPNTLYRNNGDGTFTDVSVPSGIATHIGKGMGVAFADYDQDGYLDVFVANDTEPNFLFRNDGRGKFEEIALRAGVAYNDAGATISSMGADFRDYDNDGRDDLLIFALANETFPLFRNLGKGFFLDVTGPSLMGKITHTASGWSGGMFDLNNDGYKDILVAGGNVQDNSELFSNLKSKQSNVVLANLANGRFVDYTAQAGDALREEALHRGVAFGDFDGDGRVDAVVTRLNDRPELLHNISPALNHWLAFRLKGRRSNRDGIGARIHVVAASGLEQWNHVTTSVGFACSSDKTVFFGLGKDRAAKRVEIQWPSGALQQLRDVAADRYVTVEEPAVP